MADDFLWWRDGVIYQIYPRSFADSNGDGTGDLEGIIAHLDHLNGTPDSLGVDAIWLSPIYPSPMADFGYDVADYTDVHPLFGDLAAFDRLLAEAHQRGMRVIMDLVLNHSSDQHPWFQQSRSSRENPKRDWYIWRDGRGPRRPPNNWQSVFGGKAWTYDRATGQWYYHMFLEQQPDLNWRNPEVRAALLEAVRFWLDRGVDGFRLDVFNLWFKDPDLRDNPPALGLRAFDRQKHIHDKDRPEMLEALGAFRALLDQYPERASVGELFGRDPEMAARYVGDGTSGLQMVFNFEFLDCNWRPRAFQQAILAWERALHPAAWPCYVLSNHDVSRHVSRYGGGRSGDARAKVAAALLLTLRGTPFLYYGEEMAMRNGRISPSQLQDPPSRRYWPFLNRDVARTPMPWDSTPNAGFTSPSSRNGPWLPINKDYRERNIEAQRANPDSVFHFYRRLIALRRTSPALQRGSFRPLIERPVAAMAYLRETETQTMLVALNFFSQPVEVDLPYPTPPSSPEERRGGEGVVDGGVGAASAGKWIVRLSTEAGRQPRVAGRRLKLAGFEAAVLERSS